MRKLITISLTSKGREEEAARLQPFEISRMPTETECIISLRGLLNKRYFEREIRRLSKKLENTENITITPPMDKMEVIDL